MRVGRGQSVRKQVCSVSGYYVSEQVPVLCSVKRYVLVNKSSSLPRVGWVGMEGEQGHFFLKCEVHLLMECGREVGMVDMHETSTLTYSANVLEHWTCNWRGCKRLPT